MAKTLSSMSQSYNLRFIRETEKQVQLHLESQISRLAHDPLSIHIIEKMIQEEKEHHDYAHNLEPAPMPRFAQNVMAVMARGMKAIVRFL